jgi:hypothetical protein
MTRGDTLSELCALVDKGDYCLLLGPKYSGRTTLLKALQQRRAEKGEFGTVHIRPFDLVLTDERRFFESFAVLLEQELQRGAGDGTQLWPQDIKSKNYAMATNPDEFNVFLDDLLSKINYRLVLMIDGIDRIPPNILTRLAHIAHALYQTRVTKAFLNNVSFVFAGAISLRYLTFYERPELSPFNVCTDVILRDVNPSEARNLLEQVNDTFGLALRYEAIEAIVEYAGGDLNMVQRMAFLALEHVGTTQEVDRSTVERVVQSITHVTVRHEEESLGYAAMLVEEDPPTLDLVLQLLKGQPCRYEPNASDAALYDEFNITYPEMAGALVLDRADGMPIAWRFRNKITRQFFERHFTPQRIVKIYSALGQFETAVKHCDDLLTKIRADFERNTLTFDDSDLKDVLIAFTNRIYEQSSYELAYHFLALLLREGFGCTAAKYYDYVHTQKTLRAVQFLSELFANDGEVINIDDEGSKGVLEVRALNTKLFAIESAPADTLKIAIPLLNINGDVTGVVSIHSPIEQDSWASLNFKIQIIQRAIRVINIALSKVELDHKGRIIDSARVIKESTQPLEIFVAHKFHDELLRNLREHLGRVSDVFRFEYVDERYRVGLLFNAIEEQIKAAGLCLFEMSMPNNNVYLELGLSIGLNRPGLMFTRDVKGEHIQVPPLVEGIFRFRYPNYHSLIEELTSRVDQLLKRYLVHRSEPDFVHFVSMKITPRQKVCRYAVVLDHNRFGDQEDYRHAVGEVLETHKLRAAYAIGLDVPVTEFVTEAAVSFRQFKLLDLLELIRHADVIIGRVEKMEEDSATGQVFVGLGIALGLAKPEIYMTRLLKDFKGSAISIPSDLKGLQIIEYSALADLKIGLNKKVSVAPDHASTQRL